MPRVHTVEKARKAKPAADIKVGDKYYYWTFKNRMGPGTKVVSKTYPKPSQLTRSAFKSQYLSFSEQISDLPEDDGLYDALQGIAAEIKSLGEEQQSNLDNMPEGLQQGDTGTMLQERAEGMENWGDAIEGLDEPELGTDNVDALDSFDDFFVKTEGVLTTEGLTAEDVINNLHDAAMRAWTAYQQEVTEAEEADDEAYGEALSNLKQEALDADPGVD